MEEDSNKGYTDRLTVKRFAKIHVATLTVLIPLTMFFGDPNSPYWMALFMAYFTSRPLEGYRPNQTRTLVVCSLVAIMLSMVSIPVHLLFPTKAADWYIGPMMTFMCLALAACARYVGQRMRSSTH